MSSCLVLNEDFGEGTGTQDGSSSSSSMTATTSSAGSASEESTAAGGPCGPDLFENNDQEGAAAVLPEVQFTMPEQSVEAILEDADSFDWYELHAAANSGGLIANATFSATRNLPLCAYVLCDSGIVGTGIECNSGSGMNSSPVQGLPGCCGDASFTISYSCSTPMPDATLFFRITGPGDLQPGECIYQLNYDF